MKVIIAAAGTGGHINPRIAIANEIKKHHKFDAYNFNFSCIKDPQKF